MAKAKKKSVTREDVFNAISDGESPCPDCGAEWETPKDEDGQPTKKAANKVMNHADDCVRWEQR